MVQKFQNRSINLFSYISNDMVHNLLNGHIDDI
uniref:Uncharacterized protein n=1 Tax=Podoviridae sp. ctqve24 TaxID=2826580 RepID=A0A8S5MGE9_9CAUD|nr:MAG TPA: hypothetical protein [Podoviridae sp. ctqve24]